MMKRFLIFLVIVTFGVKLNAQTLVAESKGNFCFLNNEKIQSSSYPTIQTQQPVFADFNQDGNLDVAFVANNENKLFIQLNTGSVSPVYAFTLFPVHHSFNYNTGNAVAGDFNNDGKPDLATVDYLGNVFTFRNNGTLNFVKDSILPVITGSGFYGKLYPIKLDNDNKLDLLCVSITVSPTISFHFAALRNVSSAGGALNFSIANSGVIKSTTSFTNNAFDAQSGDLNNDGVDELMFVSNMTGDSVTVMYSFLGTLNYKTTFGFGGGNVVNKKLQVTDVNSDGSRDIAVMGSVAANLNYIYVYAPVVTGSIITSMYTQTVLPILYTPKDFNFSDLNNDGLKELVVINGLTNAIQVYPQAQPLNFVSPPLTFTLNNHYPEGIGIADTDNNLRKDIVSFSTNSVSTIAMLRNFTYRDSLYAIPNKSVLCNGESIVLKHELKGYPNAFSSSFSNFLPSLNHTIQVSSSGSYTAKSNYTVIASAFNCSVTSNTLIIQSGITPTINLTGTFKVCSGDTAHLIASGADSYSWSNGSQSSSVSIIPSAQLFLSVTGISNSGCTSVKGTTIEVYPNPTVSIQFDKNMLCPGETEILKASGALTYTWSNGVQSNSVSITQISSAPVQYTVTGTDVNGCRAKETFASVLNPNCVNSIKVTNGITPNNDGNNDFFFIENIDKYPDNKVSIFNRWGAVMYNVSGYDNKDKRWPKDNMKEMEGTYFYVIETGSGDPPIKGWLEIIGN